MYNTCDTCMKYNVHVSLPNGVTIIGTEFARLLYIRAQETSLSTIQRYYMCIRNECSACMDINLMFPGICSCIICTHVHHDNAEPRHERKRTSRRSRDSKQSDQGPRATAPKMADGGRTNAGSRRPLHGTAATSSNGSGPPLTQREADSERLRERLVAVATAPEPAASGTNQQESDGQPSNEGRRRRKRRKTTRRKEEEEREVEVERGGEAEGGREGEEREEDGGGEVERESALERGEAEGEVGGQSVTGEEPMLGEGEESLCRSSQPNTLCVPGISLEPLQ